MTLVRRGQYRYGDAHADVRSEILRFSQSSYPAEHFAEASCSCGGTLFRLKLDENEGAAVRTCCSCQLEHPIADSDEYLEEAELEECECVCGAAEFQLTVGVALYASSKDVRWLYIGCRCVACELTAVYGEWKNEYENFEELLAKV